MKSPGSNLHDIDNIFQRVANLLGIARRLARDLERIHMRKFGLDCWQIMMGSPLYRHSQYTLEVTFTRSTFGIFLWVEQRNAAMAQPVLRTSAQGIRRPREKGKRRGRGPLEAKASP